MNTQTLLVNLLSEPSVSPDDHGCLNYITAILEPQGIDCRRIDIETTSNLFASHGTGAPHICFVGHTDVVPAGNWDDWTSPPFTPTERDGKLYARGAADMKSGVAAMTVAFAELIASHPNHIGTLSLLLTSDEEAEATYGVQAVLPVLEREGIKIDYAIVGEPTSKNYLGDTARNGRRGSLNLSLTVRGAQGHVAYPENIKNPIHGLGEMITQIAAIEWDCGNQYFPATSCQVSNIHAGTGAENVVPERAHAQINWRYNTEQTEAGIKARVTALVNDICQHKGLTAELSWRLSGEPFATNNDTLMTALANASKKHTGHSLTFNTAGGTSDARFMAKHGADTVEYGPSNATIHKIDEYVLIADLEPMKNVYRDTILNLWSAS